MAEKIALRPALPTDAPALAALFRASVEELAQEDYGDAQIEAWAALADDESAFAKKLAGELTIVALVGGEIAGFASLKGADHIAMVYVDPGSARAGVGAMLLDALERIASARGAAKLTAEVSDTARPLFDRRQFVAERRNLQRLDEEWLANTTMSKALAATATKH